MSRIFTAGRGTKEEEEEEVERNDEGFVQEFTLVQWRSTLIIRLITPPKEFVKGWKR